MGRTSPFGHPTFMSNRNLFKCLALGSLLRHLSYLNSTKFRKFSVFLFLEMQLPGLSFKVEQVLETRIRTTRKLFLKYLSRDTVPWVSVADNISSKTSRWESGFAASKLSYLHMYPSKDFDGFASQF